jgi:squalene-hopene/tetraprenyl-beta-curcumene cyclase
MTLNVPCASAPSALSAEGAVQRPAGDAAAALASARDRLLNLQQPGGWWKGELETNVTMDAEDLLLRQFLGVRRDGETAEAARWIRSAQRADGTWATFHGGPGDLSTTVEAYAALRLAGDSADAEHMAAAAEFIRAAGGIEATRVFTRIWLAMFGQHSWDDLPVLPPEIMFLPPSAPLSVYAFGCWARQTIVPLTVVSALRPTRPLGFDLDELRVGSAPSGHAPLPTWTGAFQRLDALLHRYERHPVGPVRRKALRLAGEWVLARQEADGGWGGIQPPWVYSLIALHLLGYPLDHPAMAAGLDGLEGFLVRENTPDGTAARAAGGGQRAGSRQDKVVRRLEACQSPVWDTCLAVTALADAGVPGDDPRLIRAAGWLLDEEIDVPGDWAVRRPNLAPGGWAFEFANDGYPDIDDTAEIVLALRRVDHPDRERLDAACRRGVDWLVGMASADGGWGAFDADNTGRLPTRLPFCDFGEVIDPPSADVTAHAVELLAAEANAGRVSSAGHGGSAATTALRRGAAWLRREQEADGSWFGRWGANHVYGTGAAVPALVTAGARTSDPAIRRAVRWLETHQNDDGGWGEDMRSYDDPAWVGHGASTASQTAWALLALLAAGECSEVVDRGIGWLVATQRPDGGWDEPEFTGTGFPGDFYINYHLYRLVFPVTALGRYCAHKGGHRD